MGSAYRPTRSTTPPLTTTIATRPLAPPAPGELRRFLRAGIQSEEADLRPNIVFTFADDWGRYASAYRGLPGESSIHELIETPDFDRGQ